MVKRGRLKGADAIGVRVGKVVNVVLDIGARAFRYRVDEEKVQREAALDGIYIIRTSLAAGTMSAADAVRSYKQLSTVERAFRCDKTIDLKVRPIHHHVEERVRAHIFLCLLAYYVEWHMIEAWRPLLFCDEDQQAKQTRDPVAPARRSTTALDKVHSRRLADGSVVHSFRTLLGELTTIVRNICRPPGIATTAATFELITRPNTKQAHAAELLRSITV
jgi:hypothetical protein